MSNKERLSTVELKFVGRAEDRFSKALKRQMEMHKGVTLMDLMKFLYQSSLGSFHLLEMMDEAELEGWIGRNFEHAKPSDGSLTEELYGKKWVRVNFGPFKKRFGNDYQRIYEAFLKAKRTKHGQPKEYTSLLKKLVEVIRREKIRPIAAEPMFLAQVESFLREYQTEDFPPIHHSQTYMMSNSSEYLVVPISSLDDPPQFSLKNSLNLHLIRPSTKRHKEETYGNRKGKKMVKKEKRAI